MIEDVAEGFGTTFNGKYAGSFGDVATFSFFGNKTITTGEGGMVASKEKTIIEKYRYYVQSNQHVFEIDHFLGANAGLTVAEVELNSENESFTKPSWIDREVTGEIKYYNSSLSNKPFQSWN